MFSNNLSAAMRDLRHRFGYTFINITGLAIGLASCLIIASFVNAELEYDRFHESAERIYRVNTDFAGNFTGSFTDGRVGPQLAEEMPEIETTVRISRTEHLVEHGQVKLYGWDIAFVDSTFFEVFDFKLIRGGERSSLSSPTDIVITESMAERFFAGQDPMGRVLRLDGRREFTVTGVLEDVPVTSHYRFDALAPIAAEIAEKPHLENWGSIALQTYVLLTPGASVASLKGKLAEFSERVYDRGDGEARLIPTLFPMTDIHLKSATYEIEPQGDMRSVYVMASIGFFILLLACINYMNLATARSSLRAREVGVRKMVGASPMQLITQFLTESVTLAFLAVLVGTGLAVAAHPVLLSVFDLAPFPLALVDSITGVLFLCGVAVAIGLFAGIYPAFVLTRSAPISVLKGIRESGKGSMLRKGLVVAQFAVSVTLLASTFVAARQLEHMRARDLGFDQENVVNVFIRDAELLDEAIDLKSRLASDSGVQSTTVSSTGVNEFARSGPVRRTGDDELTNPPTIGYIFTDSDFLSTMGIELLAGNDFVQSGEPDPTSVLITAEAAATLGFERPADAVGEELNANIFGEPIRVRGVVNNIQVRSPGSQVPPAMLIHYTLPDDALLSVRLAAGDHAATLDRIEAAWNEAIPDWPLELLYLDEVLQQRSISSERMASMFGVFAGLAVFIGCMGLFGLATQMAERRRREIGVRKVLGASARQIVGLITKEFALLVLISVAISAPVVKYGMERWLSDFSYRIEWTWWVVVWAGIAALALALATVSTQAFRAAMLNPVDSIRDD